MVSRISYQFSHIKCITQYLLYSNVFHQPIFTYYHKNIYQVEIRVKSEFYSYIIIILTLLLAYPFIFQLIYPRLSQKPKYKTFNTVNYNNIYLYVNHTFVYFSTKQILLFLCN